MDFWSRLLAHTPLSSGTSRKDAAKDHIRRLHRFEKEYGQMLQIWRNSSSLHNDADAAEAIDIRLQALTAILADESRRPLPHPCIAFAASKQVYIPVAKIAVMSCHKSVHEATYIVHEAIQFFATLIESEEEAFVESEAFAVSLTNLLVRITGGANSIRLDSDAEVRVVELAFNITTKIRLDPHILPAWFKVSAAAQQGTHDPRQAPNPSTGPATSEEKQQQRHDSDRERKFVGRTQKQDFPLFYLLVDYIHHEGKVGDFARTGLLYVIEAASSSGPLEQWIVESDLSTLMATGLGALYSQLSRKLVIDHPANNLPPVLALSDYQHPKSTYEIVSSCAPEFQAHLDTFLSHLLFWQDVLNHCRSIEVKQTLLEHFQVIFLQQLLYPSLLESSDIDGGSSVAVLTYLRRILESLDHPDMINLILHYLLAVPDRPAAETPARNRTAASAARKRKSMDLLTMMAAKTDTTATPLLYNLVDLILACLRSHSHQTVHVTLQLISSILRRHHRYATATLLHTEGVHSETRRRTVGAHRQEVDFFTALAGAIGGQDNFNEVYEDVLRDTVVRLESHPCSLKLVAPKTSTNNHDLPAIPDSLPGAPRDVRLHTVRVDDPVLHRVMDLLETFFLNPVDTNLSTTDVVLDLATCGFVSVEGWLLRHPDKYVYEDGEDDDDADLFPSGTAPNQQPPLSAAAAIDPDAPEFVEMERARAMRRCRRRPRWTSASLPRLMGVLQTLVDQVAAYRETIPRFDDLLQQRREAFQTAASGTTTPMPPRRTNPPTSTLNPADGIDSRSGSPARPSGLEGFAQRILAELGTPSRSGSPRGRRRDSSGLRSASGTRAEWGPGTPSTAATTSTITMSGGYGLAMPTSISSSARPVSIVPPPPLPPREFPINYDTPTKSGGGGLAVTRSYSPAGSGGGSLRADPPAGGSLDGRDPAVASQIEAFRSIDQKILARRVGLPRAGKSAVQPIPLDFGKKSGDSTGHAAGGLKPEPSSRGAAVSTDSGTSTPAPEEARADKEKQEAERTVSVSHIITNALVLQSFLLELAALIQVRAGIFDEVRFI